MAQLDVELILARHLVSRLAVPVLLVDARGDTLFFNEPAELIFGRRFEEFEAMPFEARTGFLAPIDEGGRPLAASDLPGMLAMRERRPVHRALRVHGLDGVAHDVEATGIPLEGAGGQLLGAMVVLWASDRPATTATEP